MPKFNRLGSGVLFAALLGLVAFDSKVHFDPSIVQLKRKNQSAQRNWNIFYGQHYNYADSSIRYESDLKEISSILEEKSSVLSDMASSYYLAASSSAYVVNVQKHHGARYSSDWSKLLKYKSACNLNLEENKRRLIEVLNRRSNSSSLSELPLNYMLVNNDTLNKNVRLDCLWQRRQLLIESTKGLHQLVYQGEFLDLYKFE